MSDIEKTISDLERAIDSVWYLNRGVPESEYLPEYLPETGDSVTIDMKTAINALIFLTAYGQIVWCSECAYNDPQYDASWCKKYHGLPGGRDGFCSEGMRAENQKGETT